MEKTSWPDLHRAGNSLVYSYDPGRRSSFHSHNGMYLPGVHARCGKTETAASIGYAGDRGNAYLRGDPPARECVSPGKEHLFLYRREKHRQDGNK